MYYLLDDDDDYYEDAGHIMVYPELPEKVSFLRGEKIAVPLTTPLRFKMDPEWGADPMIMMGSEILLMRDDLVKELRDAGADNIDTYDAIIANPYTGEDMENYKAANIIGLVAAADLSKSKYRAFSTPPQIDAIFTDVKIDESKAMGFLLFRMAESVSEIVVHEKVKKALEKKFPSLEFIPA